MSREAHVRICERLGVKFPGSTRPVWMWIDLGLGVWKREKLRLRGIDTPELRDQSGVEAKDFVETQFKRAKKITITTTRPDKYDRYLTDIWLGKTNLNQLLIQKGLAHVL